MKKDPLELLKEIDFFKKKSLKQISYKFKNILQK